MFSLTNSFAGDLAVAHALRDQLQDLELAGRNAEILLLSLVEDERLRGSGNRDFLHHHPFPCPRQLEPEPDAKNGKGRRDQPAINFDRMFDHQEAVLGHLQQGDQDSTEQPIAEHLPLHKVRLHK